MPPVKKKKAVTKAKKTPSKGKRKGSAALQSIVSEAQKIRRSSPGKKWTTCIKEASKVYRAKK